jgi:hypothetical protein
VSTCLVCSFVWRAGRCLLCRPGMCNTWQGFSLVIRCYAWRQTDMLHGLDGSDLRASRLGWDSSRGCAVPFGAPPHRMSWLASRRAHVFAAADRDASYRLPLWWPRVARTRAYWRGTWRPRRSHQENTTVLCRQAAGRTCRRSYALKSLAPKDPKSVSWQPRRAERRQRNK